jgi:hypothetical protein
LVFISVNNQVDEAVYTPLVVTLAKFYAYSVFQDLSGRFLLNNVELVVQTQKHLNLGVLLLWLYLEFN